MPDSTNDLPAALANKGLSPLEEARLIVATARARVSSGDIETDVALRIQGEALDDVYDLLCRMKP